MQNLNRKTAPKVVCGKVHKKNSWALSPHYNGAPQPRAIVIDRRRPGEGFRHVLNTSDIYRFLEVLPDWDTLAVGLHGIVLDSGAYGYDGYHTPGLIAVCAWEAGLWREVGTKYYEDHREIFDRLGVECEKTEDGWDLCKFEEPTVRAYQLLHILLHELGHHRDRMTTRSQKEAARGEPFAEDYAIRYETRIWQAYQKAFRL